MAGTTPVLKPRLARLHDVPRTHVESGAAPGLVSLVTRKGEVHVDAIGSSSTRDGHPLGEDAIFRISSMTKPVTAVATLILIEECVLRLDESIERLLPELGDRRVVRHIEGPVDDTVPADRSITVRDLLTFRMGFGAYFGPSPLNDLAAWTSPRPPNIAADFLTAAYAAIVDE